MGKDRQPRGQKKQGGPPAADAAGPDDMGPKKGKGAPKECGEEEARTCCGCRFPLLPALLQLALGIAVTVVGFLMASISSSLLVRDTPFWAGIIVCLVAYLGLFMLCVSYQVDERTCIQFAMKAEEEGPQPRARGQGGISMKALGNLPAEFCLLSSYSTKAVLDEKESEGIGTTLEDPVSERIWTSQCFGVLTYETPSNIPFLCDFLSFLPSFLSRILRKGKENLREKGDDFYYEFRDYV
uniref:Sarcospan n=1 Tax=Equus asinus TaxID=9793 RepID=A0A9L0I9C9_EQUAS